MRVSWFNCITDGNAEDALQSLSSARGTEIQCSDAVNYGSNDVVVNKKAIQL